MAKRIKLRIKFVVAIVMLIFLQGIVVYDI